MNYNLKRTHFYWCRITKTREQGNTGFLCLYFLACFLNKKKEKNSLFYNNKVYNSSPLLIWLDFGSVTSLSSTQSQRWETQHIWIQWDLLFSLRKSTSFSNKDMLKKKKDLLSKSQWIPQYLDPLSCHQSSSALSQIFPNHELRAKF